MRTLDIPQANDLGAIRRVVSAISMGHKTRQAISDFSDYSKRHTQYRLHAARVLGLARPEEDTWDITILGETLLEAAKGTSAERVVYADAIGRSPILQIMAPDLLGPNPPTLDELSDRLFKLADLSVATAVRRAEGLLAWRHQVLDLDVDGARPVAPLRAKEEAPKADQLSLF